MSIHIFVMPIVSSVVLLYSLSQNGQNDVKHIFQSCDAISATLLICDTNCIIDATIFIGWRQLKQDVTWLFWSCEAVGTSSQHHMTLMTLSMATFSFKMTETGFNRLFWTCEASVVSYATDGTINSTTTFLSSGWSQWAAMTWNSH